MKGKASKNITVPARNARYDGHKNTKRAAHGGKKR